MDPKKLTFNLAVDPASLSQLEQAAKVAKASMLKMASQMADVAKRFAEAGEATRRAIARLEAAMPEMEREALDLYRGEWWKRGEGEPEFLADLQDPEWWQDGDEPPPWGCAA